MREAKLTVNSLVAISYAQYGVQIFPCREGNSGNGKSKAPYVEGGWHSATASDARVRQWWKTWPNAVIGLPCRMNGIIAVDADRHGQEDGVAALLELFLRNDFDPHSTPTVSTPRSGIHCLFSRPPRMCETKAKIAPALDIRDSGYVVAPGSRMADGRSYQLSNGSIEQLATAIGSRTLPEVPPWLAGLMVRPTIIAAPANTVQKKA